MTNVVLWSYSYNDDMSKLIELFRFLDNVKSFENNPATTIFSADLFNEDFSE